MSDIQPNEILGRPIIIFLTKLFLVSYVSETCHFPKSVTVVISVFCSVDGMTFMDAFIIVG